MSKAGLFSLLLVCAAVPPVSAADAPRLGQPADPALLKAWDTDVSPDGAGLPRGHGSARQGAEIFAAKCAMCHGEAGAGKPADRLTGGVGTLTSAHPIKTVASYWPYATTLFGYIRVAMPVTSPRTLSDDEAYALCAYLLSVDGIVPANAVLDAKSLPRIKMPNRDGFRDIWDQSKRNDAR
jgi:S-disulfanyl-L-cysteine oxidoreductase SoxD